MLIIYFIHEYTVILGKKNDLNNKKNDLKKMKICNIPLTTKLFYANHYTNDCRQ